MYHKHVFNGRHPAHLPVLRNLGYQLVNPGQVFLGNVKQPKREFAYFGLSRQSPDARPGRRSFKITHLHLIEDLDDYLPGLSFLI